MASGDHNGYAPDMAGPRRVKQYEPIRFGEPYNPRSVEGHRDAVAAALETRRFNKMMKEQEALIEALRPLHIKLLDKLRRALTSSRGAGREAGVRSRPR